MLHELLIGVVLWRMGRVWHPLSSWLELAIGAPSHLLVPQIYIYMEDMLVVVDL
jgi:hypothetical protein